MSASDTQAGRGESEKADVDLAREINERQAALGELRREVAHLTEKVLLYIYMFFFSFFFFS